MKISRLDVCALIRTYRPALLVYAALRQIANGERRVQCVRRTIQKKLEMNVKTISTAMSVLKNAGWIRLKYGCRPHQNRKWYRITFPFDEILPGMPSPAPRGARSSGAGTPRPTMAATPGTVACAPPPTPTGPTSPAINRQDAATIAALQNSGCEAAPCLEDQPPGQSDTSLDPRNGSKDSASFDPSDGPNSLERVGGAPPSAPPTLCFGGHEGTPQAEQGLKSGSKSVLTNITRASEVHSSSDGDWVYDARSSSVSLDGIERIIAMIGSESSDGNGVDGMDD